jgi:hypothetical protein
MKKPRKYELALPAEVPDELSPVYFEDNPRSYSNKIYRKLQSSDIYRFLVEHKGKDPTAKEKLTIAAVVITGMDQRIEDLETDRLRLQREASTIRAILGNPIWDVRPAITESASEQNSSESETASEKAERQWIARYLTLGNVLGAIVVILGLLGGVFTYLTTNYKDRAGRFQANAEYWEKQADAFKKDAESANAAKKTAESQREADAKTINDQNDRLRQSQSLSSSLSEQLKQANKRIEDLQKPQP